MINVGDLEDAYAVYESEFYAEREKEFRLYMLDSDDPKDIETERQEWNLEYGDCPSFGDWCVIEQELAKWDEDSEYEIDDTYDVYDY